MNLQECNTYMYMYVITQPDVKTRHTFRGVLSVSTSSGSVECEFTAASITGKGPLCHGYVILYLSVNIYYTGKIASGVGS